MEVGPLDGEMIRSWYQQGMVNPDTRSAPRAASAGSASPTPSRLGLGRAGQGRRRPAADGGRTRLRGGRRGRPGGRTSPAPSSSCSPSAPATSRSSRRCSGRCPTRPGGRSPSASWSSACSSSGAGMPMRKLARALVLILTLGPLPAGRGADLPRRAVAEPDRAHPRRGDGLRALLLPVRPVQAVAARDPEPVLDRWPVRRAWCSLGAFPPPAVAAWMAAPSPLPEALAPAMLPEATPPRRPRRAPRRPRPGAGRACGAAPPAAPPRRSVRRPPPPSSRRCRCFRRAPPRSCAPRRLRPRGRVPPLVRAGRATAWPRSIRGSAASSAS